MTTTPTTIYGLFGFTHGWGKVLTVMSAAGIAGTRALIEPGADLRVQGGRGRLTQYHGKRGNALQHLVEAYGIVVLSKPRWDAKKEELGDAIWR